MANENEVLDVLRWCLEKASSSTNNVMGRGNLIFGSSAGLVSFVSAAEFIGNSGNSASLLVVLSAVAALVVACFALRLWSPRQVSIPMKLDREHLRTEYLKEGSPMMLHMVSNHLKSLEDATNANKRAQALMKKMLFAFLFQVILVLLALGCRVLSTAETKPVESSQDVVVKEGKAEP